MTDIILQKFFEPERWEYAIDKGVGKDIDKAQLYQLTKPEVRAKIYEAIRDGRYEIAPPHTAQIPKDNGEFRTVYINEPIDRILLSIANDLLFMSAVYHIRRESDVVRLFKAYLRRFARLRAKQSDGSLI